MAGFIGLRRRVPGKFAGHFWANANPCLHDLTPPANALHLLRSGFYRWDATVQTKSNHRSPPRSTPRYAEARATSLDRCSAHQIRGTTDVLESLRELAAGAPTSNRRRVWRNEHICLPAHVSSCRNKWAEDWAHSLKRSAVRKLFHHSNRGSWRTSKAGCEPALP